jgi:hypothetical protein
MVIRMDNDRSKDLLEKELVNFNWVWLLLLPIILGISLLLIFSPWMDRWMSYCLLAILSIFPR